MDEKNAPSVEEEFGDEVVEAESIPGLSELAEQLMLCALDEAKDMLETGGNCPPLTLIVKGEDIEIETHPGESILECIASARVAVLSEQDDSEYYAFCYDGYVDTDRGHHDALIVECAKQKEETGHVICCLYNVIDAEGDELPTFVFDDDLVYLGETPSFFSKDYSYSGETELEEEVKVPFKNEQ